MNKWRPNLILYDVALHKCIPALHDIFPDTDICKYY